MTTGAESGLGALVFIVILLVGLGTYGSALAYESGVRRGRCIEVCSPEPLETTTATGCVCSNVVKPLREKP